MLHVVREIWPSVTQLQLLFATFALYLFLIIAFGLTYFRLYSTNPDRFFIPAEISASQEKSAKARSQLAISSFNTEIHAMEEVRKASPQQTLPRLLSGTPKSRTTITAWSPSQTGLS